MKPTTLDTFRFYNNGASLAPKQNPSTEKCPHWKRLRKGIFQMQALGGRVFQRDDQLEDTPHRTQSYCTHIIYFK